LRRDGWAAGRAGRQCSDLSAFRRDDGEYYPRVRTILLGVLVAALPLACSSDDDDAGPATESGGLNSGGGAGKGGGNAPAAGNGGARTDEGAGAGGEPPSSGDSDDAERLEDCEAICATTAELACPSPLDECLADYCGTVPLLPPWCVPAFDVLLDCLATQPGEGFQCEDGKAYVKEETCAGEQAAFVDSCDGD
jgi:hypothetical protein